MLAQSFKTAKQLRLSEQQYEALKKTLVLFETGKIQWTKCPTPDDFNLRKPKVGYFNMGMWKVSTHSCGTVACIGGTAELLGDVEFFSETQALYNLFNPYSIRDWDTISVEKAAMALRNYLTTGHAHWRKVMRGKAK